MRSGLRSTRDCPRDSCNHLGLLADRRLDGNFEIGEIPPNYLYKFWQVILQMPADAEEHWHHAQRPHPFGVKRRGAFL